MQKKYLLRLNNGAFFGAVNTSKEVFRENAVFAKKRKKSTAHSSPFCKLCETTIFSFKILACT